MNLRFLYVAQLVRATHRQCEDMDLAPTMQGKDSLFPETLNINYFLISIYAENGLVK